MFWHYTLLLFAATATVTTMAYERVLISNPTFDLFMDASQYEVKLEKYTGHISQIWTLEPAGMGKYSIINMRNGHVMDIQGGAEDGANIITYPANSGKNQLWFINSDATIVSASHNLAVDVHEGIYNPGARIIATPKDARASQKFNFQVA